jgi:hypothetical protein
VSDEQTPPDNREQLNRELRVRVHDRFVSILEKSEEATIKSAENSIRIILLINGGAAVAILAFVGSLASKDRVTTTQLYAIAGSLVWFASGVASSALTAFFFYLTNISYLFATQAKQPHLDPPYISPTPQSVRRHFLGRIFHVLALAAAFASWGLFVYGMCDVRNAIVHLG